MSAIKNMNYEEEKAVEELEMRMKNGLTLRMREDRSLFYRFLKARDFDVDKAEKMLLKNLIWRKIFRADTVLQDFKPKEFFPLYIEPNKLGFDKDGDMVVYVAAGNMDVYDVFKSVKLNDFMKHWTWFAEKNVSLLEENNAKTGKYRYQASLIMDLKNLTLANTIAKMTTSVFLLFTHMYQDNYPERMKSLYVINAPAYYVIVFAILKTVMSSAMIKKIHVFGYSSWKEKLLEFIDADVLPAFLGGNRTDPDGNPLCESFIRFGGKIPEKYFLSNEDRYFTNDTPLKKIFIPNSDKKEIYVDVQKVRSLLQWEFLVKRKDIGFGLFYQDFEENIEEILPICKYDTSDGSEKDHYKCHSAGKYILLFDNSYSWLSSKEVEYYINVVDPEL